MSESSDQNNQKMNFYSSEDPFKTPEKCGGKMRQKNAAEKCG